MPFGPYADFKDCVAKNASKDDPEAYCAVIEKAAGMGPKTAKKGAKPVAKRMSDSDFEEADANVTVALTEGVVLLDRSPRMAKVVQVGDDTVVIPEYDGAFSDMSKPWQAPTPMAPYSSPYDLEDAARMLGQLARVRQHEKDEPEQAAMLDTAIDALASYLQAEATEDTCEGCGHAMECDCTACDCDNHGAVAEAAAFLGWVAESLRDDEFQTLIEEVGKRNSKRDAATLRQIIDLVKSLGIEPEDLEQAQDAGDIEPVAEAEVDTSVDPDDITFREAGAYGEVVTLAEAAPVFDAEQRVVWVTPIRPGWGNTRDNNFYPTETLKEATENGRFNHLKMYKDHPRKSDEKDLPERSVKDWFATTREAEWDEKRQKPRVPIKVHDEADFRRMQEAPEQVAFSVLGGGMARPGAVDGRKGRIVESISKLRSLDWVTEAGAGGGIDFAESASTEEQDDMDIENLTPDQLAEANPALYEHLVGMGKALAGVERDEKAKAKDAGKTEAKADVEPKTDEPVKESEDEIPAWFKPFAAPLASFAARESAVETATQTEAHRAEAAKTVTAAIAASTLPGSAKDIVKARFDGVTFGEGQTYTDEAALTEAVESGLKEAEAFLAPFRGKSGVTGLGASSEDDKAKSPTDLMESRIDGKFGAVITPRKDRLVMTPEQLGDPSQASTTSVTEHTDPEPAQFAVSEAAAGVASSIDSKF